ncbi:MAG TPA: hypothetical protein VMR34_05510 [Candidatus Saccharimonadales bacterium]|nr:hypothetical protein [Candidatus Saccharimonadales bacterium]
MPTSNFTKQSISTKKMFGSILFYVGILGYVIAALFFGYAVYFLIIGIKHPNAAEDTTAGLSGIGFYFTCSTGW